MECPKPPLELTVVGDDAALWRRSESAGSCNEWERVGGAVRSVDLTASAGTLALIALNPQRQLASATLGADATSSTLASLGPVEVSALDSTFRGRVTFEIPGLDVATGRNLSFELRFPRIASASRSHRSLRS